MTKLNDAPKKSQKHDETLSSSPNVPLVAPCGEGKANFCSRLSFWWIQNLISLARKKTLEMEDIPDILESDKSRIWKLDFCNLDSIDSSAIAPTNENATTEPTKKKKPSLIRAIRREFSCTFACAGFYKLLHDILQYSIPVFISLMIQFFEKGATEELYDTGIRLGYIWALSLFLARFLQILKLSPNLKFSAGNVVNLVSNDAGRIMRFTPYMHNLWSAPFQIVVAFSQLYYYIGWPSLVGLVVIFFFEIFFIIHARLVKILERLRKRVVEQTDARVKLITDVIAGIKVVKLYSWEDSFTKEIDALFTHIIVQMINYTMWNLTPMFVSLAVFATYSLTGNEMTASKIFTALSIFRLVRFPIIVLPFIINAFVSFRIANVRISKFMIHPEVKEVLKLENDTNHVIEIKNAKFVWYPKYDDEIGFSLNDINLSIEKGQLIAVCGSVGSGKSSLLSSILGEMIYTEGSLQTCGTTAYVPQTAWIVNATVRENICLSRGSEPFDRELYSRAIEFSQLKYDFELLPAGDSTEIGEKGINLSGGQKQRIALARAFYSDSEIFVFDDVFSALDSHVGRLIFDGLFKMTGKTRIVATHQLHLLPRVDRVLVLKDGCIVDDESSQNFLEHMASHGVDEEKINENDIINKTTNEITLKIEKDKVSESEFQGKGLAGHLTEKDARQKGSVQMAVILINPKSNKRIEGNSTAIFQAIQIFTNLWLAFWTEDAAEVNPEHSHYCIGGLRAATNLHNEFLTSLLLSPLTFFETTPSGRILSRCSEDVDLADNQLREAMSTMIRCIFEVIGTLALVLPLLIMYYLILQFYRQTSRELKRIGSLASAPIFSNLSETLSGLPSIRSFCIGDYVSTRNCALLDTHHRAFFHGNSANRWLGIRLEFLGSSLIFATAVVATLHFGENENAKKNAPMVGLALVWGVRQVAETETHLNAVERLMEYMGASTSNPYSNFEIKENETVMQTLATQSVDVQLRYRPGLPLALRGVSVAINGGEKIGVCGRTGAGKSSLLVALYRLVEHAGGCIKIDGRDISKLGLHTLRSRLAIIPQDPVLFYGTVRSNLDPFETCSDETIWDALGRCQLKDVIEAREGESGSNFSNCKILMLDEATASVDYDTDILVQNTIREEFASCTCIFIAHRLSTIIDCDRIIVMDDGIVSEFGTPKELVASYDENENINTLKKRGEFLSLLLDLGQTRAKKLISIANGKKN
eukprot:GSMAST32.ASY1.ANO1.2102.1 assembled CDS